MLNPLNDWNIVYNQLRETTNAQEATFQQVASRYRNDITMSNSTSKVSYFKLVPLNKVKVIQGYARDKEELLSIIKKMKNGSWEMYSFKDIDKYQLIGVLGYANEKLIFNYTNIFNLKSNVKTKYNAYSLHNIRLFFYFMPKVEMNEEKIEEFKKTLKAYFDIYTNKIDSKEVKKQKIRKQKICNQIIVNAKNNNYMPKQKSDNKTQELAFSSVIVKEGLFFPYYNLFYYNIGERGDVEGINITQNMINLNINPIHKYICAGEEDPLSEKGKERLLMCNADSAYTQATCNEANFFDYIEANVQLAIELMEKEYVTA